ncbi:hypothetical protein ACFSKW_32905 [Nonomuraea mangrovi]|uniref:Uncharacterized protein n=1 Tax=Nonomuraea mangrovi TaxID=2316207 RepID=A0ABW4T5S9_9ACTN
MEFRSYVESAKAMPIRLSVSPGTARGATDFTLESSVMIKIRHALAAGAMGASALIVPVTMPAQLASAEPVAGTAVATAPVLSSAADPCARHKNPQKCREQRGGGDDELGDDNITRPEGGGVDD